VIVLKTLIVTLVVLVLLLLLPIGVDAGYCEGELRIYFRVGSFTFGIYPPKKENQKQDKKQNTKSEKKKSFPDVTKDEVLDAVAVAVKSVKKLRFRMHKLKLHFISAFDDPYQTAMVYGYVSAAVNAFALPAMKRADVQLGVDFERETYYVDGYLSVTIKLYYIIKLLGYLVGGLIPILWRRWRRLKANDNSGAVKGKVA